MGQGELNGPAQASVWAQRRPDGRGPPVSGSSPSRNGTQPRAVRLDERWTAHARRHHRREGTLAAAGLGGRGAHRRLAELGDDEDGRRGRRGSRGKQRRLERCTAMASRWSSSPAGRRSSIPAMEQLMWMGERSWTISEEWGWWCGAQMERERPPYIASTGCRGSSSMTTVAMALRTVSGVGEGMAGLWAVQGASRSSRNSIRWSSTASSVRCPSSCRRPVVVVHGRSRSSAVQWVCLAGF